MPVMIEVSRLRRYACPISTNPWRHGRPVTIQSIETAIKSRRYVDNPGTDDHPARIAFFVINPSHDAIEIDVGVPSIGAVDWIIQDGNHRLAAAIYRGDKHIACSVSGCVHLAMEMFGVDVSEGLCFG